MNDDLKIVPARYNDAEDDSEYEEIAARPRRREVRPITKAPG